MQCKPNKNGEAWERGLGTRPGNEARERGQLELCGNTAFPLLQHKKDLRVHVLQISDCTSNRKVSSMSGNYPVPEAKCRACRHEVSDYSQEEPDAKDLPAFKLPPKHFKG